ncbi:hypothetical protein BH11VER1_BH11VER1_28550 [soil metagenome]
MTTSLSLTISELYSFHVKCRSSSEVEQRIRNARVAGSIPAFGSSPQTMPPPSEYELAKSAKIKGLSTGWQILARIVGIISAAAILSAIGFVIYKQIQLRPKLEWDYVEQMYGPDGKLLKRPKESNIPNEYDVAKSKMSKTTSELKDLDKRMPELAGLLEEFFEAKTIPELLPLVRDARRVRPLIEDYYARHAFKSRSFNAVTWAVPVDEPGYRFAYAEVTFNDSPPINVVVEFTDIGFLVDWESSNHYSEIDWDDFIKSKSAEPKLFRLLVSKTGNDISEGDLAGGLMRLKLNHPIEAGDVYAIIDPKDQRFQPLLDQLKLANDKEAPVILRLFYPERATASDEVEIASVEGKGWLILDRLHR